MRIAAAGVLALCLAVMDVCDAQPGPRSTWDDWFPKVERPPQGLISELHFSRDGRYILAQEHSPLPLLPSGFKQRGDSAITVLTVQPLAILFRVLVDNARFAGFTPDSKEVIFVSGAGDDSHVEHLRVADGNQARSFEIATAGCVTLGLSPDGRTLLCAYKDGTLRATDVASQETILERKKWGRELDTTARDTGGIQPVASAGQVGVYFSPDGRFVITRGFYRSIVWDLRQHEEVRLFGRLAHMGGRGITFIAPDRLLVYASWQQKHGVVTADLVEFPTGEVVSKPKIPRYLNSAAADPEFVICRPRFVLVGPFVPSPEFAAAAANLTTGKVIIISDYPALDAFGQFYVAESNLGEVRLYEIDKGLQAKIKLPGQ